nr:hypothetical protein [Tanacetum cinerariifolium]
HAVAIASAQKNKGSFEAESIVRAASTRVRFRLSITLSYCNHWGLKISLDHDAHVPSQQELDLRFGPLYDEFFTATNIQTTSAPSTPTNVHAEENNDHQTEEEHLPDDEFTNPFSMQEELHQFDRLQFWELVDKSFGKMVIRLKWLWKNKKDEDQTEEVYVTQPDGFVDPNHPEKVYRLRKALYGLKQAPRAWYDEFSKFLTSKGFTKGLQIHQSSRGIFLNQAKYALEILYKHGMEKGQIIGTPMATKPKVDADLSGNPVDQTDYRSKIGSLMYLTSSRPDIVQADCTAMSSAEVEYVALSASCAQVMWMRTQLQDYGFNYNKIPLYCDAQSAIAILCNLVQHSRTKHIHTR